MKRRTYKNGMLDEHPVIFPNILRQETWGKSERWMMPMQSISSDFFHLKMDQS